MQLLVVTKSNGNLTHQVEGALNTALTRAVADALSFGPTPSETRLNPSDVIIWRLPPDQLDRNTPDFSAIIFMYPYAARMEDLDAKIVKITKEVETAFFSIPDQRRQPSLHSGWLQIIPVLSECKRLFKT